MVTPTASSTATATSAGLLQTQVAEIFHKKNKASERCGLACLRDWLREYIPGAMNTTAIEFLRTNLVSSWMDDTGRERIIRAGIVRIGDVVVSSPDEECATVAALAIGSRVADTADRTLASIMEDALFDVGGHAFPPAAP